MAHEEGDTREEHGEHRQIDKQSHRRVGGVGDLMEARVRDRVLAARAQDALLHAQGEVAVEEHVAENVGRHVVQHRAIGQSHVDGRILEGPDRVPLGHAQRFAQVLLDTEREGLERSLRGQPITVLVERLGEVTRHPRQLVQMVRPLLCRPILQPMNRVRVVAKEIKLLQRLGGRFELREIASEHLCILLAAPQRSSHGEGNFLPAGDFA